MPIFVDPNVPNPPPPEVIVSPDGELIAVSGLYGVQLRATFDDLWAPGELLTTNLYPDPGHEYGPLPWTDPTVGGSGTIDVDTALFHSGDQSVIISTTADSTQVYDNAALGTPASMGFQTGDQVTYSAWVYVPSEVTLGPSILNIYGASVVSTNLPSSAVTVRDDWQQIVLTIPIVDATGPLSLRLFGGTKAGNKINFDDFGLTIGPTPADFSGDTSADGTYFYRWAGTPGASPSQQYIVGNDVDSTVRLVRFERNGEPIRSGNPAWAVGGVADAFDYEIAPGETVQYRAFPLNLDQQQIGDPTEALAITAAGLDPAYDCWLKSMSDPSLMGRFEMQGDPEFTQQGADTLEKPFGAGLYAGGIDTAPMADAPFVFKITGKEDLDLLQKIIDSGVVLWQSDGRAGLDNFYGVRQTASSQYMVGSQKLLWLVSVTFRKVARPSTYGSPLVIPGYSYGDTQATAATFADRQKIFPAFENTIGQPIEVQP